MELALYIGVVLVATALSQTARGLSGSPLFQLSLVIGFSFFSLSVRSLGFDADIVTYARRMESASYNFYYLREPVVWLGHRLLFALTQSHVATFVISDVLCFVVLIRAFQRLALPRYALVAIIAFFPFVMGMQNIYRQWVAGCFALYALSLSDRHLRRSILVFVLAVASHNAAALFFPVVFSRTRASISVPLTALGIISAPIILLLGADSKSSAATGLSMEAIYLTLIATISVLTCSPVRGVWQRWIAISAAYSTYLVGCSTIVLSSAGAERTALFALVLLYPAIIITIERHYLEKALLRTILTAAGFIPVLIFGVRHFIL